MSKYTVPKIWGPYFWFVMRCIAYNYSGNTNDVEYQQTHAFYNSLQYIIPCEKCRATYTEHLSKYPLDKALLNRDTLMQWVETIYVETQKISQSQNNLDIAKKQLVAIDVPPKKTRNVIETSVAQTSVMKTPSKQNKLLHSRNVVPQVKNKSMVSVISVNDKKNTINKTKFIPTKKTLDVVTNVDTKKYKNNVKLPQVNTQNVLSRNLVSYDTSRKTKDWNKKKFSVTKRCNCGK